MSIERKQKGVVTEVYSDKNINQLIAYLKVYHSMLENEQTLQKTLQKIDSCESNNHSQFPLYCLKYMDCLPKQLLLATTDAALRL